MVFIHWAESINHIVKLDRGDRVGRRITILLVLSLIFACENEDDVDENTIVTFDQVLVPGACFTEPTLREFELSVMPISRQTAAVAQILPTNRVDGQSQLVSELLNADSFEFTNNVNNTSRPAAIATAEVQFERSNEKDVALNARTLNFIPTFPDGTEDSKKLVIFVVDHSISLKGVDPETGLINSAYGSDDVDQRIAFFRQLTDRIEQDAPSTNIALVTMNTESSALTSCDDNPCITGQTAEVCSSPTRNRELTDCGLGALEYGEKGETNLNQTLRNVMSSLIATNEDNFEPVVVLFTDGVEKGDPSGDLFSDTEDVNGNGMLDVPPPGAAPGTALDEDINKNGILDASTIDLYVNGPNGRQVPVIVFHLQANVDAAAAYGYSTGRSYALSNLACLTGGEYVFVPTADDFTQNQDLVTIAQNRLRGVWRLSVDSRLMDVDEGGVLLSTTLSMTLAEETHRVEFDLDQMGRDRRLWLYKGTPTE